MTVKNSHFEDADHCAKEEDENRDWIWRMMMEGIKSRKFNYLEDDDFEDDDGKVEK